MLKLSSNYLQLIYLATNECVLESGLHIVESLEKTEIKVDADLATLCSSYIERVAMAKSQNVWRASLG